jgi:hypothetical protein
MEAQASGEPIQSGGVGHEQQFVTKADMEAFAQRVERLIQSTTDKQESRLKKEFDQRVAKQAATFAELGIQMTDDDKRSIAREVALSAARDGARPGQGDVSPAQQAKHPVDVQAEGVLRELGVSWDDMTLREVNSLVRDQSPEAYLESVRKAAQSAAKRVGPDAPRPNSTPATAPAIGGGQPAGGDLAAQYRQEVIAAKGKGPNAFMDIRKRYRERGLDVESIKVFDR